jgi:lysophospholipase L1-like esterase
MELKNKVVCFLGDSITEGAGASSPDKCLVSLFTKAHPEAKVYNFGIGGTRIAKQITPSVNSRWDKYFAGRIKDMPKVADLIFVFGGTNDYGHGDAPFGEFGDTDEYTFSGAVYSLMKKLIETAQVR